MRERERIREGGRSKEGKIKREVGKSRRERKDPPKGREMVEGRKEREADPNPG